MSSTTASKKELVDFLWEWADNHGTWGQLLIQKIVGSESALTSDERQVVFEYFLASIGLKTGLPSIELSKPIYAPTDQVIELEALSNVTGVNRLAKDQVINFSPNLTVIFGENGTGKTGYGRILKSLGFSYDTNNAIISNIYEATEDKSAKISFKINGTSELFDWNGDNKNSALSNISVFNNNCVQISLGDRELLVSPIGFHLFSLVSNELIQLNTLLNNHINAHPTTLLWSETLNVGTPQYDFIANLDSEAKDEQLFQISSLADNSEQQLTDLQKELTGLNKGLLENGIRQQGVILQELGAIRNKLERVQLTFNVSTFENVIEFNKRIAVLESQTKKGIKEIAEQNGINFYETLEFQNFIQAAENYIQVLGRDDYPSKEDKCMYCHQPLADPAIQLLGSYRELLNDKSQEELATVKKAKSDLIHTINLLEEQIVFHQPVFGMKDEKTVIQPVEIVSYNQQIAELKKLLIGDNISEAAQFNLDYKKYIKLIEEKVQAFEKHLSENQETLRNLSAKELTIKNKIAELIDRRLLASKIEEVKTAISNHKIIAALRSNANNFSTQSISRKTTQAREELVKSDFEAIFKEELKGLGKSHIHIDLNLGTDRGTSKLRHRINTYSLADILSEGEQKAIALAEFLSELQLDNIKAPVIFDDPVNSLDHHIIDDVARRLLKLSRERQVIIFTHSVLLFNSFLYFSKTTPFAGIQCSFLNSRNEYGSTGFIQEAEELNNIKTYLGKINTLLNNTPKGVPEAEVATNGYGYLRSCIELLVEHEIFNGTIKRYQKNVALTQFGKVNGTLVDTHKNKLYEIFERCSGFINGHSNPTEIIHDPTVLGLKTDFDDFQVIRKAFVG